jgi:putative acetyltransferase
MATALHLADIPSNEELLFGPEIELRAFQPGDARVFRSLNEAWIRKYFTIEAMDNKVLLNPEAEILAHGGHIFFAVADGKPVGCCALLPRRHSVYELGKMAVAEAWQGHGIGRKLLKFAMKQARARGASSIYLETNSRLTSAIHLYESLGFKRLPARFSDYARSNVFMERPL